MVLLSERLEILKIQIDIHFSFSLRKKCDTSEKRDLKTSSRATEYYATPSGKPSTWLPLEGLVEQIARAKEPRKEKNRNGPGTRRDETRRDETR